MLRRRKGATATEYGLLVGMLAVVLLGVLFALGVNLRDLFWTARDCIAGQTCEIAVYPDSNEETPTLTPALVDVTGAELSTPVQSNALTVGGFTQLITLRVSGNAQMLVDGQVQSGPLRITQPTQLQLQTTSADAPEVPVKVTLVAGAASFTWTVTSGDMTPELNLSDLMDQVPGSLGVATGITPTSYSLPLQLTVDTADEAALSLNGSDWSQGPVTLAPGQSFRLRQRVPNATDGSCAAAATVTLGTVSGSWRVCAVDSTPDFALVDLADQDVGVPVESAPFTLEHMSVAAPASLAVTAGAGPDAPGLMLSQGGSWTPVTLPGTVPANAELKIVWTAGALPDAAPRSVDVTIGGVTRSWSVSTKDATPAMLSFTDVPAAELGSVQVGETLLSDFAYAANASVTGPGGPQLALSSEGPWSSSLQVPPPPAGGSVALYVRMSAADAEDTARAASVSAGPAPQTFTVTTGHATPAGFDFDAIANAVGGAPQSSNTVQLAGMTISAPFTLTGSGAALLANGAPLSSGQKVPVNASIQVTMPAGSGSGGGDAVATLAIGSGTPVSWTISTEDTQADGFSIADTTNTGIAQRVASAPVQVKGVSRSVGIAVSGDGSPSVETGPSADGPWLAGTSVGDNGWFHVLATSASADATSSTVQVQVGSGSPVGWHIATGNRVPGGLSDFTAQARATGTLTSDNRTLSGMTLPATQLALAVTEGSGFTPALGVVGDPLSPYAANALPSSLPANATVFLTMGAPGGQAGQARTVRLTVQGQSASWHVTAPDATPDSLTFTDLSGVAGNQAQTSNALHLAGMDSPGTLTRTAISQGAVPMARTAASEAGLATAVWTNLNTSGLSVAANAWVQVQTVSGPEDGEPRWVDLALGDTAHRWTVRSRDTQADIAFTDLSAQEMNRSVTTEEKVVSDIDAAATLGLAGDGNPSLAVKPAGSGSFGPWRSLAEVQGGGVTISPGDSIRLAVTTAATENKASLVFLSVGGATSTWTVTTGQATPAAFAFADTVGATGGQTQTQTTTLSGMTLAAPFSVSSSDGAAVTVTSVPPLTADTPPRIPANAQVTLSMPAPAGSNRETRTATLTVNGRAGTWAVQNLDTTPDGYAGFAEKQGQTAFDQVTADAVTINGLLNPAPVVLTADAGFGAQISVNNGAWGPGPTTVANGQKVQVRLNASSVALEWREATVTVGGVAGKFRVRTQGTDSVPDNFTIAATPGQEPNATALSATITPQNFDRPVTVSFVGNTAGDPYISVEGGTPAKSATLLPGQSFVLSATSGTYSASVQNRVQVGAQDGTGSLVLPQADWTVTTRALQNQPTTVAFANVTKAIANSTRDSEDVTPTGFRDAATVTVEGSSGANAVFAINGGQLPQWQVGPATLRYGDSIRLRVTTGIPDGVQSTATLRFNGVAQTVWSVTSVDTMPDAGLFSAAEKTWNNASNDCCQCHGGQATVTIDTPAVWNSVTCSSGSRAGPSINSGGSFRGIGYALNPNANLYLCLSLQDALAGETGTCSFDIGGRVYDVSYAMQPVIDRVTYTRQLPFYTGLAPGAAVQTPWYAPYGPKSSSLVGVSTNAQLALSSAPGNWMAGTGSASVTIPYGQTFSVRANAPASGSNRVWVYQNGGVQQYFDVSTAAAYATALVPHYSAVTFPNTVISGNTITVPQDGVIGGHVNIVDITYDNNSNTCQPWTLPHPFNAHMFNNGTGSAHIGGIDAGFTTVNAGNTVWANAGFLCPGEWMRIAMHTPNVANQATASTFTVAGPGGAPSLVLNFNSTLTGPSIDGTPTFTVPSRTGVPGNMTITQSAIPVGDYNTAVNVTIGGEASAAASVDGGASWARSLTISPGQSLALRMTSGASNGETRSATVTLGQAATQTWSVTTLDDTPDTVAFANIINRNPGALTGSEVKALQNFSAPATLTLTGDGNPRFIANGGSLSSGGTGTLSPGSSLQLYVTASGNYGDTRNVTVKIGGLPSFVWSVTTRAQSTAPAAFTIPAKTASSPGATEISGAVSPTGFKDPAPISVASPGNVGAPVLVIDGVDSGQSGTLNVGSSFQVRMTASSTPATPVTATVNIGGVTADFVLSN